ncbi:MAG TPA: hypothetical protein VGE68_11740 [Sphingomicrobium sp.]
MVPKKHDQQFSRIHRNVRIGFPVERCMCETADKLRTKARQTRFLARQTFSRARADALHSLAIVYEDQAAEMERAGA